MSARLSTGLPAACSGLMYAAVPSSTPTCVAAIVKVGESVAFGLAEAGSRCATAARPKSSTFTTSGGT